MTYILKDNLTMFAPDLATFQLPSPAGELEVVTEMPADVSSNVVAIICHPHPLFGGTLSNKVVSTLARTFKEMQIPTVRFNFRGVGKSTGQHDEGIGEIDDLLAVISWVKQVRPNSVFWLAGFSFGSCIAAKVAVTGVAERLISIAPPVMRWGFDQITVMPCPWIVIQGDKDEVVAADEVFAWFSRYHPQAQVIAMEGAGHFFHGRLVELRETLLKALVSP
jgi:alpha/beta superfamily hydrolase